MAEPFTLTAYPGLLAEGEFRGHLEFVTFVARRGDSSEKWTSVNVGSYVDDFARIMPREEAADLVARLRRGETVEIPGYWHLDEVKHKFGGAGNE
jgi:hypothetical protein